MEIKYLSFSQHFLVHADCVLPLGMKSGRIEDSQITASDYIGKTTFVFYFHLPGKYKRPLTFLTKSESGATNTKCTENENGSQSSAVIFMKFVSLEMTHSELEYNCVCTCVQITGCRGWRGSISLVILMPGWADPRSHGYR